MKKLRMMKKLKYVLIVIATINIIIAFFLFNKEGTFMYVSSENEEIVKEALKEEIVNVEDVNKVMIGSGWHSGELTIYHRFSIKEIIHISNGMFKLGELEQYIRNNGYNLDTIGEILVSISGLIILYIISYSVITNRNIKKSKG